MKVWINGKVYDATKEPVVIIFENDEERKRVAGHITNMPERDSVRLYASYPDNDDKQTIEAIMAEIISQHS